MTQNARDCNAGLLAPLPPIVDLATDWMERAAVQAEACGSQWSPGSIAASADDRKTVARQSETGTESDHSPFEALPELMRDWTPAAFAAGPDGAPPLSLRREVISTLDRYVTAVCRSDSAFAILEQRLTTAHADVTEVWSIRGQQIADGIRGRLLAVRGRREAMRACCLGRLRVIRFRCGCCGGLQYGPPCGCNGRTCPRCVRKVRREQMAHVHDLLDHVDEQRRRACRPLPRWRFVTLTSPSLSEFGPMRRMLGEAWSRLMRRDVWADNVKAAIAAWETTHTDAGWHVHAHIIADAWIPQTTLARAWQQSVLQVIAAAVCRGEHIAGLPGAAGELADALRADPERAQQFGLAARRLVRWAEHRGELLYEALASAPLRVVGSGAMRGRGRNRRFVVDWDRRADLLAMLGATPNGAGAHIKEPQGDRLAVVSELAKYCGKDLGGAQVDSGDTWGVAGTPERLADFLAGSFRWRTLRTYGDAHDAHMREQRRGRLECDECGSDSMQHDGTEWVTEEAAHRLAAQNAAKRKELRAFRSGQWTAENRADKVPRSVAKCPP